MKRTSDNPALWFITAAGREVPSVTSEEMREIDRIAMQETGPNLFQMMENAGRNLASLAMELLGPEWSKSAYVILAGPGGNGGGGICAARHLANRGLHVRLCLADPEGLGEVGVWGAMEQKTGLSVVLGGALLSQWP